MSIEFITARRGAVHVDSDDVRAFNRSLFGNGTYVLKGCEATVLTANSVNVAMGELMAEGGHIRITGTGETVTIDNGATSYKRHDLIALHYVKVLDDIEELTLEVLKGTPSDDTPEDPELPAYGSLENGDSEVYWPIYRVVIDGLTPQEPVLVAQRQAWYTLGLGEEIPAGADLNDYKTPGVYSIHWTAVSTLAHKPKIVETSMSLEVSETYGYNKVDEPNIRQRIIYPRPIDSSIGGFEFARNWNGIEWSEWKCVSGVDSVVNYGTGNIDNAGYTYTWYASGRAELNMIKWVEVGSLTWGINNLYLPTNQQSVTFNFPFRFEQKPIVVTDCENWTVETRLASCDQVAVTLWPATTTPEYGSIETYFHIRVEGSW